MQRLVVTDSTSCLHFVQQEHRVEILPLNLHIGSKCLRDVIDVSATDFIGWMRDNPEELPYSTPPKLDEIQHCIETWLERGIEEVLVITLSSGISKTYENMKAAAELYREEIEITVFDSKTALYGQAILALEAERLIGLGMQMPIIVQQLEMICKRSQVFFTVGQLNYLIKNERLSVAAGMMANMLKIKPVLGFNRVGAIDTLEKKRKLESALETILWHLKQFVNDNNATIFVMQSGNEVGNEFLARVQQNYPEQSIISLPPSPVIACHTGPELYGVGAIRDLLKR